MEKEKSLEDSSFDAHRVEVQRGDRFEFGDNWTKFLDTLNEHKVSLAEQSLLDMLRVKTLAGRTFLDAGSGSGLMSLAARRLGARVHSFDYDPQSVRCTEELRRRFFDGDPAWSVQKGSVLDQTYLDKLDRFDVVYSWGVLHHTGAMWQAMANVAPLVAEGGQLYIAIYNDQEWRSRIWLWIKRLYNRTPASLRWLILGPAMVRLWGPRTLLDFAQRRPFYTWRHYDEKGIRGMDAWRDVLDWVGGLPFEVAKPDAIFDFYRQRGFVLDRLKTCGGALGCNELVFIRGG